MIGIYKLVTATHNRKMIVKGRLCSLAIGLIRKEKIVGRPDLTTISYFFEG